MVLGAIAATLMLTVEHFGAGVCDMIVPRIGRSSLGYAKDPTVSACALTFFSAARHTPPTSCSARYQSWIRRTDCQDRMLAKWKSFLHGFHAVNVFRAINLPANHYG
jgi:hypothetical protein